MSKKGKKKRVIGALLLASVFFVFYWLYSQGPYHGMYLFKPSVEKYGDIALNMMDNGLYAEGEQWEKAREKAKNQIKQVQSYEETHPILEEALQVSSGRHGFIVTPVDIDSASQEMVMPTVTIDEEVLILKLPEIIGTDADEIDAYAETLARAVHQEKYQAVMIDMRGNMGGNVYPMLQGVGSLLEDDTLLTFIMRDNNTFEVILDEGEVKGFDVRTSDEYKAKVGKIPVAILIDSDTASSGEMLCLAFKGRADTKTFGEETAGFTTANQSFKLYDGSFLQVTAGRIKDSTGEIYDGNPIIPDIKTSSPYEEAMNWLRNEI